VDLDISVDTDAAGRRLIRLTGSLDLQSRDLLLAGAAVTSPDTRAVVVNMAEVTFIDSSGIGAMVELASDADDAGVSLSLQDPSPRVLRILEITGLLDVWPIEDSVTS
jgi:anti-sigma B factor antagonist